MHTIFFVQTTLNNNTTNGVDTQNWFTTIHKNTIFLNMPVASVQVNKFQKVVIYTNTENIVIFSKIDPFFTKTILKPLIFPNDFSCHSCQLAFLPKVISDMSKKGKKFPL